MSKNANDHPLNAPPAWAKGKWEFIAPNGQPAWINLCAWMQNSQAIDANGAPIRVFHGTNQTFERFDASRLGANTTAASSIAFFFSECPDEAAEYAAMAGRQQIPDAVRHEAQSEALRKQVEAAERAQDWDLFEALMLQWEELEYGAIHDDPAGMQILPCFLRVERPLVVDMRHSFDGHEVAALIAQAKQEGCDGLKLVNVWDAVDSARQNMTSTTQWVVFEPDQIVSATGNDGCFEIAHKDALEDNDAHQPPKMSRPRM